MFAGVLALIISEKVHRALAALMGAVLVLLTGILPFEESLEHIDFNTLGVLVGMMLFVAVARRSGLFGFLAIKSAKLARGDPWRIMVFLMIITAVLSGFLDNVTTVLLIGPMTLMICRELRISPVPFFMTQIIASNIGGTATLIGDPPNIMIGSAANLSFVDFLLVDAPVIVIIMVATVIGFRFVYKKRLSADAESIQAVMAMDEDEAIVSKSLFVKSIVMIGLVAVGFSLHGVLHIESAVIALSAAAILMLIGRQNIDEVIDGVEWPTIGFFVGLFIVVGGMVATGVIDLFALFLVDATGGNLLMAVLLILLASAVISAIVDNIPFVATMIPVILTMGASGMDVEPLWWALSLGACLGGNGTLIGASANVVLSGISNREGYPITYLDFLKIGGPMMILSILISAIYLVLRFCV
ncbi:MAG: ArsB/NhaD family transporter [Coriobacteriales bacterium]|nr:ArsB/NhaD family transporter [Coriobacteriales bacterium]